MMCHQSDSPDKLLFFIRKRYGSASLGRSRGTHGEGLGIKSGHATAVGGGN